MHIAIVGAGITGLMSALELLEQGCSVTLFDQQAAGQAASCLLYTSDAADE